MNHITIKLEPNFKYIKSQGELMLGVYLKIDGQSPLRNHEDDFNLYEIFQSRQKEGEFFIFTCSCGIPECAGYKGVNVTHQGGVVEWYDKTLNNEYAFDKILLDQEIGKTFEDLKKWVFYAESNNLILKVYPDLVDVDELMNSFESK